MNPVHTSYADAETLAFPGAITLKILLSGTQTEGAQAVLLATDAIHPQIKMENKP